MSPPSDVAPVSQDHVERYISYGAAAALLTMFVEYGLTLRDERRYIWPKAHVCRYAKMYIVTRYLGLATQIFNVAFALWRASQTYIAPSLCRSWYAYQAILIQALVAIVDGLLMRGVYAMFSGSYWILSVLTVLAATQPGSMLASAIVALPEAPFTPTCLIAEVHSGLLYFGSVTLTTHAIILLLIVWKYFAGGQAPTPLRTAILRDTTIAVTVISVVLFITLLCALRVIGLGVSSSIICLYVRLSHATHTHTHHTHITPPPSVPLSLPRGTKAGSSALSGCRIIVGWEAARSSEADAGTGVLTSHVTVPDDASVYAPSEQGGEVQKGA
ncbi:hypothetical protein BV22DRAFT_1048281 [Leucogyrophana mollusca]|uniref:Uncharacterized protein n=1 Tax=Leucogyrophana mollusca TaxID=85980 RepID=A0ACB8BEX2_9AGAM|nr:hypothetical protein BV22DRAFT_1048281 [Leucogyrophana mollusca]